VRQCGEGDGACQNRCGPTIRYWLRCFGQEIAATVPDGDAFGQLALGSEIALSWRRHKPHLIGMDA
jgi:hypothetical protein